MNIIQIQRPIKIGNRLQATIAINGIEKVANFDVDSTYAEYLDDEVCDAFLINLLLFAMGNGYDIKCDAPVSAELLFNLRTYFLPILNKETSGKAHLVNIEANPLVRETHAIAVGTGVSGGIDSSDAIMENLRASAKIPNMKLTHLLVVTPTSKRVAFYRPHSQEALLQRAEKISTCLNLPLIKISHNLADISDICDERYHPFYNLSCVFALGKQFKTYFYASAYTMDHFSIKNGFNSDADYMNMFMLPMLSTPNLRFYLAGLPRSRLEKTRAIANEKWVQENLSVCTNDFIGKKCGFSTCNANKCKRTMWDLEICGALDKFSKMFDADDFRKNHKQAITWLYNKAKHGDNFAQESWNTAKAKNIITKQDLFSLALRNAGLKFILMFIPVSKWRKRIRSKFYLS